MHLFGQLIAKALGRKYLGERPVMTEEQRGALELMARFFEMDGGSIPWAKRAMVVMLRDSFTCHYCGKYSINPTVDHKKPWSAGGSDDFSNLVCACAICNRAKGAKSYEDFLRARSA